MTKSTRPSIKKKNKKKFVNVTDRNEFLKKAIRNFMKKNKKRQVNTDSVDKLARSLNKIQIDKQTK